MFSVAPRLHFVAVGVAFHWVYFAGSCGSLHFVAVGVAFNVLFAFGVELQGLFGSSARGPTLPRGGCVSERRFRASLSAFVVRPFPEGVV